MLNSDRRTYYADLYKFLQDYTKRRHITLIDTIDAIGDLLEVYYYPDEPRADKDEIQRLLAEYAEAQGETIGNIYDVLGDVIEQAIDDYIDSAADTDD